jgi:spore photoproduct lyase
MRRAALAGYPVGLTIAPIMPHGDWREAYRLLLRQAASALAGLPNVDLTMELITHRFHAEIEDGFERVVQCLHPRYGRGDQSQEAH